MKPLKTENFQKFSIIIIGAGSIVNHAHLPAYRLAGFPVAGMYDVDFEKAKETADRFGISKVFGSFVELLNAISTETILDIAVPGDSIIEILNQLPDGATVLLQKPMGNNWAQAKEIARIVQQKNLLAGVNLQLRYAPFISKTRQLIEEGRIGQLCDIDIYINVFTPWHLWPFLRQVPFMELYYHSIHYIDLVRSFLGNPAGIWAQSLKHPAMEGPAQVRSNILMHYGDNIRVSIHTNHHHHFSPKFQEARIKLEGTQGAICITPGVLINYPAGIPDTFSYINMLDENPEWQTIPIEGSWFPHAFAGSMGQMILAKAGLIPAPDNSVADVLCTMACLEAATISSGTGMVNLPSVE
jgi:predicted dehydrogenase